MSDTLTQLTTKLQALLLGDSDTFSTDTCTAAIRQALKDLNLSVPQHAAETQDAVTDQYEYELEDQAALLVVDVLLEGTDTYADINTSLPFDFYIEDDSPFIRLMSPCQDGDTLIIRYTKPYIINGLDGETSSTLPALHESVLLDGAAWRACIIRAAGRIETINMNQDVPKNYAAMAEMFHTAFTLGLARLGLRRFPVSGNPISGWNDEWAGQY